MGVAELLLAGQLDSDLFDEAVENADASDIAAALELVGHDDPDVRRGLASTLPFLTHGDPPTSEMVQACIRLSGDPDASVRDWACTALGTQWREVDTTELRDALAARLDDPHDDTRCEALVGLAYRRDARALPRVRDALTRETGDLYLLELVAAGALSDPQLHEIVLPHVSDWGDPESDRTGEAVRRLTSPDGPGDDVIESEAEFYRRRARQGPPDGRESWDLMVEMLDIAPHRAPEFLDLVLARLDGDAAAEHELQERSRLGQLAEENR